MKAAVLEGIGKLIIKELPVSQPGPDEVLVKVKCCGLCGTDIKLYKGEYEARIPVILGHEFSGQVEVVGTQVSNFKEGDRVVIDPNASCGVCDSCRSAKPCFCPNLEGYGVYRNGGFAEFCVVKAKSLYKLSKDLDYETSALTEPVSCAIHCMDRAGIKAGDCVVILGAGFAGQILIQLTMASGASEIIAVSRSQWKLDLAMESGATHVINAEKYKVKEEVFSITDGKGADVVIEAVGKPETVEQAISMAREQGKVIVFGVSPKEKHASFFPFEVLSKELNILGTWLNPYTFTKALDLLSTNKLNFKKLISHQLPLNNIMEGIKLSSEKTANFMKAMIVFTNSS